MKWKNLAVIALVILGCSFVSAQVLRLAPADGSSTCNYVLTQLTPYAVWEGYSTGCGGAYDATLVGVSGGLAKAGNPVGFAVKGVVFGSNAFDAYAGSYTGAEWFVATNLKCSNKKYGWIGFAGMSGVIFSDNYGYVSCDLPDEPGATARKRFLPALPKKVSAGK